MNTKMKNHIKEFARLALEKTGMNVIPVRGKKATVIWSKWQETEQTPIDLEEMNWDDATGYAAIMGNGIMVLDFDQLYDDEIIKECLQILGLESDYPWVIRTGSGHGFHIYMQCREVEKINKLLKGKKAVFFFKCKDGFECDHIELRKSDCYCVMPESLHESGGRYDFKNNEAADKPGKVSAENIVAALKHCCVMDSVTTDNTTAEVKKNTSYYNMDELQEITEFLSTKLKKGSYQDWLTIGFALSTLNEKGEELFVEMSLNNPEFNDTETEVRNKFRQLAATANGSITMGTFYHTAEKYGWKRPKIKFWYAEKGRLKILRPRIKRILERAGFCKMKVNKDNIFVRIENNIAYEFANTEVKEYMMMYIEELKIEEMNGNTREEILDLLMKNSNSIFSESFFEFLISKKLEFKEDTVESSFLFYKNGFVEVTKESVYFHPYERLDKCVWQDHIHQREYHEATKRAMFEDFLFNAMGRDGSRMQSVKSAIGKLLHRFKKRSEAKAVVFTDEVVSEDASGQSGKGLTVQAIEKMRKTIEIEGKNFSPSKNFAFQRVTVDTNVIVFQDLDKRFPFDKLFSIITDGIIVERKNKDEIYLSFDKSPNLIITTNYIPSGADESSLNRQFVVEYSGHYHLTHKPIHEYGVQFFDDWDEEEWYKFDTFMIECIQFYLQNGLVPYEQKNVEQKRITTATSEDFFEYAENFNFGTRYNKAEELEKFKKEFPDNDKLTQRKYTSWCKRYAKLKGWVMHETKSDSERYFSFIEKKEKAA